MENNIIQAEGAKLIAIALEKNKTVTNINLNVNDIGKQCLAVFHIILLMFCIL